MFSSSTQFYLCEPPPILMLTALARSQSTSTAGLTNNSKLHRNDRVSLGAGDGDGGCDSGRSGSGGHGCVAG